MGGSTDFSDPPRKKENQAPVQKTVRSGQERALSQSESVLGPWQPLQFDLKDPRLDPALLWSLFRGLTFRRSACLNLRSWGLSF